MKKKIEKLTHRHHLYHYLLLLPLHPLTHLLTHQIMMMTSQLLEILKVVMKISKNHLDIFLPLNHIFRMKFSCLIKKDLKSLYTTDFRTVSASTKSFTMRFKASRYQSAKLQIIQLSLTIITMFSSDSQRKYTLSVVVLMNRLI